ncbi:hypothetical protein ACXR2U_07710 [Jatrophihabitans sp. YIM 134969]
MSLSGSWSRGRLRRFAGRSVDALRPVGRARTLTVRRVTRDFVMWEAECAGHVATPTATMTTVVGATVVRVPLGGRPIQEVAHHLRRLRSVIDAMSDDVSFVRWEGVMRAYDDYLFTACHELSVPTDLLTIGFGRHRDEERCRLERLLHEAGLPVR